MRGSKPKILIFEDDTNTVDIYATKFSVSGFNVKVYNDYVDIPDIVVRENPDIVSCDLIMPPPMDGHEAIKKLATDKRTKDIPIIVLSNLDSKEDVDRAFKLGVIKYFVKANYTPSEVVKEIKTYLIASGKFKVKDFKPKYFLR